MSSINCENLDEDAVLAKDHRLVPTEKRGLSRVQINVSHHLVSPKAVWSNGEIDKNDCEDMIFLIHMHVYCLCLLIRKT